MMIVDGYTTSGKHLYVLGSSRGGYGKYTVILDDEQLETLGVTVARDGGSITVKLSGGHRLYFPRDGGSITVKLSGGHRLYFPKRLGDFGHTPRFDGEPIDES